MYPLYPSLLLRTNVDQGSTASNGSASVHRIPAPVRLSVNTNQCQYTGMHSTRPGIRTNLYIIVLKFAPGGCWTELANLGPAHRQQNPSVASGISVGIGTM